MVTIMTWETSDGVKGRCDDKCHSAIHPKCDCMCGGCFHGSARDGTLDAKVREHGAELVKEFEAAGNRYARIPLML